MIIDLFGKTEIVDLKPNGSEIPVTDENKEEYVSLITDLKMTKSIEQQISSFLTVFVFHAKLKRKGFHELVPRQYISIFNPYELELLISGLPNIGIRTENIL